MCRDICPCVQGCIGIFNCAKGIDDGISTLRQDHLHLRSERPKLINKIREMEERSNGNPVIESWLVSAREEKGLLDDILGPENSPKPLPSHCLCCHLHCCGNLGREFRERRVQLDQLLDENNPPQIQALHQTQPVLPLAAAKMIGMDLKFQAFWQLFDDGNVRIIGVHGMPGAGKSHFLKEVNDEFTTNLRGFEKVIWVGSSTPTADIRRTIAERLGLQFAQDTPTDVQVGAIHQGLTRTNFVLLLDNPPDQLQLQDIGVPPKPVNGRKFKVVFTAQRTGILSNLRPPPRAFDLGLLDKDFATLLFNGTVGDETLNADMGQQAQAGDSALPTIRALATEIVHMCSGLPVALVKIGEHLRNKNNPAEWMGTIDRLKCPESAGPAQPEESVYQCLSSAYTSLGPSDTQVESLEQKCFLYCCLFPGSNPIEEEELKRHWETEDFLGKDNLCLSKGDPILDALKKAHLLMSARGQPVIEMHPLIYNLGRWISSGHLPKGSPKIFYVQSNANLGMRELPRDHGWAQVERISLVDTTVGRLNQIECSRLSTLILKHCDIANISSDFFEPMTLLKVLNLSQSNLPQIPSGIAGLTSLQYLNLSQSNISELPEHFKYLRKLLVLDLSFTWHLEKIAAGVISNLTALQWLNMYYCGVGQRTQGGGSSSPLELMALLKEVQGLPSLQDLGITIRSSSALANLGEFCHLKRVHSIQITGCEAATLPESTSTAEVNLASIASANCLKVLHITKCWALLIFRETSVRNAPRFQNLCDIKIQDCRRQMNLTWLRHAHSLESLKIIRCSNLTVVIGGDGGSDRTAAEQQNPLPLSKLKDLHLEDLASLQSVCHQNLPFSGLTKVTVLSCRKLNGISIDVQIPRKNPIHIICENIWWEKNLNEAAKSRLSPFFETIQRVAEN